MMLHHRLPAMTALALVLAAPAAQADVTAAQVWDDWQDYFNGVGYTVSGLVKPTTNGVNVDNLVLSSDLPEGGGTVSVTMGDVSFSEAGDGTVDVGLQEDMRIAFDVKPEDGERAVGTLFFRATAPSLRVSGDPEEIIYTYASTDATVTLEELEVNGQSVPEDTLAFSMTMATVRLRCWLRSF